MKDNEGDTEKKWKECLTPEQYRILREKGTERAFTGKYYNHHDKGTYRCAACGAELFASGDKFDSGTGWPSFTRPADAKNISEKADTSHGMKRTEVLCSKCESHLGHVFPDGPNPMGLRYCINSAALDFQPAANNEPRIETATFGGGCFWCTEAVYEREKGVKSVKVGYMGGKGDNPTYKEVSGGKTGYAEVAQITYDPSVVSYGRLLDLFWQMHDPTSLNRQGADTGTQYRSAIFYHSDEQKRVAEKAIADLSASGRHDKPVVTEIAPASDFHEAEDYHQDYYRNNKSAPYCRFVIEPKLKKVH